ncbi:NAD(P)-binding protein [Mycena amicta]|nr:NAD(P)-binding protein [Mycena amicta]
MKLLVLGATGPTGVLLVREALAVYPEASLVLYVRSPEKLPEDLRTHASCTVLKGQLEDEEALGKALVGVDILSIKPLTGTPLAHAYEGIIKLMKVHGVNRLLALGTVSMVDKADRFNLVYYGMVTSVSISMRHAYKDILAIADVIRSSGLEHYTIVRVPILSNKESRAVIAGYIGDGKTKNHTMLNRAGFAAFVVAEIEKKEWDLKVPILVTA